MLRKSFAFILLTLLASAVTFAQDTKKSKETKEEKEHKVARTLLRTSNGNVIFSGFGGSYLGVHIKDVTNENFSEYGLTSVRGVAIEKITKDSPAAKAGLKEKDVIVRFNGEAVTSARKLRRLISEVAPDHKVDITVVRNGNEQNLNATIGKPKGAIFRSGNFSFPDVMVSPRIPRMPRMPNVQISPNIRIAPHVLGKGMNFSFATGRVIGIGTSSLTKQLGEHFGVSDGKGVLINSVRKDSPGEKAGLRAGDVIVEIDGKEVENGFDITRAISEKKEGAVNLTIIRNKNRQNISVTPEKRKGSGNTLYRVMESEKNLKSKKKGKAKSGSNFRFYFNSEV